MSNDLLSEQIHDLTKSVKALHDDVQPLIEIAPYLQEYVQLRGAVVTWKNILVGTAVVVAAVATIGAAVIKALAYIRHGH